MIPHPQIKLGRGVSLVRNFSNPLGRFGLVPWHSLSFGIHQSEVELCQGMILLGRLAIPLGCSFDERSSIKVACHRSQMASHAPLGSEESRMSQSQLVAT